MWRTHLSDLRREWLLWLLFAGLTSLFTYALVSMALALASGASASMGDAPQSDATGAFTYQPASLAILIILVSAAVLRGLSTLMVDARRTIDDRELAGASGRSERARLLHQVGVVGVACCVVADLLAILTLPATLDRLGDQSQVVPVGVGVSPLVILIAVLCNAIIVAFALWSIQRRARRPVSGRGSATEGLTATTPVAASGPRFTP